MVQMYIIMVIGTWGNSWRIKDMVMEFIRCPMEAYITAKTKKAIEKVIYIISFLMAENIMENTRMVSNKEKECLYRMAKHSKSYMIKVNV